MAAAPPRPVPAARREDPVVTVIDDTQVSPLTPADAAMPAAAHSDTDVSESPLQRPADLAAASGTCSKARAPATPGPPTTHGPPTAPSPADWAFGDAVPGQSAAGAAVETVDLLTQEAHAEETPPPPQRFWSDGRPVAEEDYEAWAAAKWPLGRPAPPPPPARSPDAHAPKARADEHPPPPQRFWPDGRPVAEEDYEAWAAAKWPDGHPSPQPPPPPSAQEDDLPALIAATWADAQGTQEDMLRWAARELQTLRADAQRASEELRAAKQRAEDSERERLRLERLIREYEDHRRRLNARMDNLNAALTEARDSARRSCQSMNVTNDLVAAVVEVADAMTRQI